MWYYYQRLGGLYMKDKGRMCQCIHYNMSVCGGFLGGYAILNRYDVFGNALTSNLIHMVLEALGNNLSDVLVRLGAVLLYVTGTMLVILIPRYTNWNVRIISVFIDMCAIVLVHYLPEDCNIILSLYPVFFAMSFQWSVFANICGYVSSTIFSTNNTRQMTIAFTKYICERKGEDAKRARFYAGVLLFYHIGVVLAYIAWKIQDDRAIFIGWLPMITALFFIRYEAGGVMGVSQKQKE